MLGGGIALRTPSAIPGTSTTLTTFKSLFIFKLLCVFVILAATLITKFNIYFLAKLKSISNKAAEDSLTTYSKKTFEALA